MLWQYQTVLFEFTKDGLLGDRYVDDEEMENSLNKMGLQSWELVNVSLLQDGLLAILKRPVEEKTKAEPMQTRIPDRAEIPTEPLPPQEPVVTVGALSSQQATRPPIAVRNQVVDEPEHIDPLPARRSFERPLRNRKEVEDNDFVGGIRIS